MTSRLSRNFIDILFFGQGFFLLYVAKDVSRLAILTAGLKMSFFFVVENTCLVLDKQDVLFCIYFIAAAERKMAKM